MPNKIILTEKMAQKLKDHLFSDRAKEQMAIILCGISKVGGEVHLLGRHFILFPKDAFVEQSAGRLELRDEINQHILKMAHREGLSQIDFHTHVSNSPVVRFSGIDDSYERGMASYLGRKIPGTLYGSVVMTREALDARIWRIHAGGPVAEKADAVRFGSYEEVRIRDGNEPGREKSDEVFSRQVMAFGEAFQKRLSELRIGLIGLGGTGSVVCEELTRLGVRKWVLVDNDRVERTNLNRLLGATNWDAKRGTPKVIVAARNIRRAAPEAEAEILDQSLFDRESIDALKGCDLLVVCTDTHASRLVSNRLSAQYLIPIVHVGVNIDVDSEGNIKDISGECVIPPVGEWCLQCASIFDTQMASWELSSEEERSLLIKRGYIRDMPSPAVYHINATMASLAVAEIHNVVYPYRKIRRYVAYDQLKGEVMHIEVSTDPSCPICSPEGVLGLGDLELVPDYLKAVRGNPRAIPKATDMEAGSKVVEVEAESIKS